MCSPGGAVDLLNRDRTQSCLLYAANTGLQRSRLSCFVTAKFRLRADISSSKSNAIIDNMQPGKWDVVFKPAFKKSALTTGYFI